MTDVIDKTGADRALLMQLGLLCPCGDRIADRGIRLISLADAHDEVGNKMRGLFAVAYCSPDCGSFQEATKTVAGVLAVQKVEPITWVDPRNQESLFEPVETVSESSTGMLVRETPPEHEWEPDMLDEPWPGWPEDQGRSAAGIEPMEPSA